MVTQCGANRTSSCRRRWSVHPYFTLSKEEEGPRTKSCFGLNCPELSVQAIKRRGSTASYEGGRRAPLAKPRARITLRYNV